MSVAPAWRSRITGHGEEAPDQLLARPSNWRIHGKAQQAALAGVLDQVGWVQNVLVNQRNEHVVDGLWGGFMHLPNYPPALKARGSTSARRSM